MTGAAEAAVERLGWANSRLLEPLAAGGGLVVVSVSVFEFDLGPYIK